MVTDEGADGVGCDVTEALVESEDVDLLGWVCVGCVGVFNSEEAVFVGRDASNTLALWTDDIAGS